MSFFRFFTQSLSFFHKNLVVFTLTMIIFIIHRAFNIKAFKNTQFIRLSQCHILIKHFKTFYVTFHRKFG